VNALVEDTYARVENATEPIGAEDFDTLLLQAGRAHVPYLVATAWAEDIITVSTLQAVIGWAWSGPEYPDEALDTDEWRYLFDSAGFTVDGKPAERPTEPIRLYRGTAYPYRCRWSWTTDLSVAERFANRWDFVEGRLPGRIFTMLAPPDFLLCQNNGRQEMEYVVDTRDLKIREVAV
jgi:hypothetical protein